MACSQRPILAALGENGRIENKERGGREERRGEEREREARRAKTRGRRGPEGTPATDQWRAQLGLDKLLGLWIIEDCVTEYELWYQQELGTLKFIRTIIITVFLFVRGRQRINMIDSDSRAGLA